MLSLERPGGSVGEQHWRSISIRVGDHVRELDPDHVDVHTQSIKLRGLLVALMVRPVDGRPSPSAAAPVSIIDARSSSGLADRPAGMPPISRGVVCGSADAKWSSS